MYLKSPWMVWLAQSFSVILVYSYKHIIAQKEPLIVMKTDKEITAKEKKRQEIRKNFLCRKMSFFGCWYYPQCIARRDSFPWTWRSGFCRNRSQFYPSSQRPWKETLKKNRGSLEQIDSGTYGSVKYAVRKSALKGLRQDRLPRCALIAKPSRKRKKSCAKSSYPSAWAGSSVFDSTFLNIFTTDTKTASTRGPMTSR